MKVHQVRGMTIDQLDGVSQPDQILVAIDMEVTDLAGGDAFHRGRQIAYRERHLAHFDLIDGAPPQAMQRPQRKRGLAPPRQVCGPARRNLGD